MAIRSYRLTTILLLVVANLQVGAVGLFIWNQQAENKQLSDAGANQPGVGSKDQAETRHLGGEESEDKPKSKRAEPTPGQEESQKQPKSERAEGAQTHQVDTQA